MIIAFRISATLYSVTKVIDNVTPESNVAACTVVHMKPDVIA